MVSVKREALPADALLNDYCNKVNHTDCFVVRIDCAVDLPQYVAAFYTTWLFKTERLLLRWLASAPSTDAEAHSLAVAQTEDWAVWRVESRSERQLLMTDKSDRTRSWLMVGVTDQLGSTPLYFGSAVLAPPGAKQISTGFRALMGFHSLYSVALLRAAAAKLRRQSG